MTNNPLYVFPSPLGWFAIAWQAAHLRALVFGHASGEEAVHALVAADLSFAEGGRAGRQDDLRWVDIGQNRKGAPKEIRQFVQRIQAYADGERDPFLDIPVALGDVTEFQRQVLLQCRRIPFGQTMTYGQLAAQVSCPRAARAVGTVMAGNRVPLVIPCHRVVGLGGLLRGYSGCGGTAMKRRLLELEGAV